MAKKTFSLKSRIWIWITCILTGQRYVPHSTRYDGCSARAISGHGNRSRRRRKLATEFEQFDAAELFSGVFLNRTTGKDYKDP